MLPEVGAQILFTPVSSDWIRHACDELANCSYALPATSELNGTQLRWADMKRKVRSSTCLSFLLKQCSKDLRRAGRECTWLTFL